MWSGASTPCPSRALVSRQHPSRSSRAVSVGLKKACRKTRGYPLTMRRLNDERARMYGAHRAVLWFTIGPRWIISFDRGRAVPVRRRSTINGIAGSRFSICVAVLLFPFLAPDAKLRKCVIMREYAAVWNRLLIPRCFMIFITKRWNAEINRYCVSRKPIYIYIYISA